MYYSNIGYDCAGNCLEDSDLIICDELEVIGCSDFLALNLIHTQQMMDLEYLGCTDSLFLEFIFATINDESCETILTGCLDVNADNYDSNANVSDNFVFSIILVILILVLINSDIPQDAYLEGEDIL